MPPKTLQRPQQQQQQNGQQKFQKADWQQAFKKKGVGVDDMTLLSKIQNDGISDNLKQRFYAGEIYTYIGHVLISVNPFRDLGIYTDEILASYVGKNRVEMPPHVFATAETAYRNMLAYGENQCVIISGESGAGKTEAAKKIMQYVAAVSGDGSGSSIKKIKDMVLATNPLLEAFGNAKTLRNNNSSRFGKYFEILFNAQGEPVGGVITNYLLEKARVVHQLQGERNFHIFYQLCVGASREYQEHFSVQGPEVYVYTSQSQCLQVNGIDDASDFGEVLQAMAVIGMTAREQYDVFRLLAAILWTGNISFYEQGDKAIIADESVLDMVAYLLEVDRNFLSKALGSRMMETKRGGARGTTYEVPLNYVQATAARDAMAKAIYDRIFDWIVARVNISLQTQSRHSNLIGVLDIYGFEIFDHNSFEQLCINYVNEKLQQIFIELTLKSEQEEYVREQIQWTPIEFFNNKIVCELIEGKKPPGIFSILNDTCATAHADSVAADKALMQRLGAIATNKHLDLRANAFCIRHYAGDVVYDQLGMTDKNKDQLALDLLEILKMSRNSYLLSLFPEEVDRDQKKKTVTAGDKIRESCNALVNNLMKCNPHYIRTIKPNETKSPSDFDDKRVMHQVKYLGLLENIRVRRAGFCFRQVFEKFLERFFLLSRRTSYAGEFVWQGDARTGCRCILEDSGIAKDEWQLGVTKAFIRHPETLWALEHLRERYWHNMAMKIQRAFRNYVRYKNECAVRIQRCYRKWNGTKAYLQLRDYGHQILGGRKERRRFSLLSMRRFLGDYLDFRADSVLQNACGPQAYSEGIVTTMRCSILVHRLLKASILSPRFLIMTRRAIYIVVTKVEKKIAVTTLERRVPVETVAGVTMSPLQDDFIVIHESQQTDLVLSTVFKTELTTHMTYFCNNLRVDIQPIIEYFKKPGKNAKIEFRKDELMQKEALFKKNIVSIASGAPPSSMSRPPARRKEPAARPITTGKLLRKGGPTGPVNNNNGYGGGGNAGPAKSFQPQQQAQNNFGARPQAQNNFGARPQAQAPPPAAAAPGKPLYKAQYRYEVQDSGELAFEIDDILTIVEKDDNGWWLASLNGKEGWVPSNYLVEHFEAPKPVAAPKPAVAAKPGPSAAGGQQNFRPNNAQQRPAGNMQAASAVRPGPGPGMNARPMGNAGVPMGQARPVIGLNGAPRPNRPGSDEENNHDDWDDAPAPKAAPTMVMGGPRPMGGGGAGPRPGFGGMMANGPRPGFGAPPSGGGGPTPAARMNPPDPRASVNNTPRPMASMGPGPGAGGRPPMRPQQMRSYN